MSSCAWSHLQRDPSTVPSMESFLDRHVLAGILAGALVLSLSYPLLHTLYMRQNSTYREGLTAEQRIVVVQHTMEAIFLASWWMPTTYWVVHFNFCTPATTTAAAELGRTVTPSTIFLGTVVLLYCFELNSRLPLRPLIVVHHVGAGMVGVISALLYSEATVITATLLVYFITYEAILFAGLVLYRLGSRHAARVLSMGMWVFGLSRPVQVLLVGASLYANRHHIVPWQGAASGIITLAFTALQSYTLTIHYQLYLKSRRWVDDDDHDAYCCWQQQQGQSALLYGTMADSDDDVREAAPMRRRPTSTGRG